MTNHFVNNLRKMTIIYSQSSSTKARRYCCSSKQSRYIFRLELATLVTTHQHSVHISQNEQTDHTVFSKIGCCNFHFILCKKTQSLMTIRSYIYLWLSLQMIIRSSSSSLLWFLLTATWQQAIFTYDYSFPHSYVIQT